jgi:sugar phosphate isomerase/epimerase
MPQQEFDRRRFLSVAGGAVAATAWGNSPLSALTGARTARRSPATNTGKVTQDMVGIQLWSCLVAKTVAPEQMLEGLAAVGIKYVEHAQSAFGYGGNMDAKQFRAALDNAGLKCPSGHSSGMYPFNADQWKQVIQDALIIGQDYVGIANATPKTVNECKQYVEAIHKAVEIGKAEGFKGRHFQHYDGGAWTPLTDDPTKRPVDIVMAGTTRNEFHGELDTNWALQQLGSIQAVIDMIRKFPGRFRQFHFKDGFAPVRNDGQGVPILSSTRFGLGDFGRPDPADPQNRPHAGFQDVLTAIRETQVWSKVLIIAEDDTSLPTCFDEAKLAADGLKDLAYTYSVDYERTLDPTDPDYPG